ncbi:MazE protein [Paraburkholderia megapolitana]|nr:MazE protein [Paraburkholderia megapolitana]QDQ81984.1 MazE protein [Paraburkholderia megapolitana]
MRVSVRPDGVLLTTVRRKYSLDDLVAQCSTKAPFPSDMTAWGDARPVGREAW